MNLLKRTLGGALILLVLLAITYFGHLSLTIGFLIFSLIAIKEVTDAFENTNIRPTKRLLYICDFLIMLLASYKEPHAFVLALIFSVVAILVYMLFSKDRTLEDIFTSIFIIMYVPGLMGCVVRTSNISYVWPLYITAWGSDTFAHLTGSLFGKRKIGSIAHISPKKTLEGSIGGIIGALVLNFIYIRYVELNISLIYVIIFSIIGAILSQLGDLVASYIKRNTGIKDFGNIIPGHGGIMDRFDSMMLIAPIFYLLSVL